MPWQPPRFGGGGAARRKPWARPEGAPDRRIRGRAGMRARAAVLAEEPLCRLCLTAGRVSASVVVDHILSLAAGGSDERENKQGLCTPCHDAKSAAERAEARQAARER